MRRRRVGGTADHRRSERDDATDEVRLLARCFTGEHTTEALTDEGDGVAVGELSNPVEHEWDRARDVGRDATEAELVGVVAEAPEETGEGEQRHVGRGEAGQEQDRPARATGQPPEAGGVHREAEQLAIQSALRGRTSRQWWARGAGGAWAGWDGSGPDTYGRSMRTVFSGGAVFDGNGGAAAAADVVVEDGRIVEVGPGLDGDDAVDCTGRTIVPGFIDSHVHFMSDGNLDPMSSVVTPFSLNFYLAAERMARTLGGRCHDRPRGRRLGSRRQGGAGERPRRRPPDVDLDHDPQPDGRARRPVAGVRRAPPRFPGHRPPRQAEQRRRRAGRDAAQGPRADPRRRRRDQGLHVGRCAVAA